MPNLVALKLIELFLYCKQPIWVALVFVDIFNMGNESIMTTQSWSLERANTPFDTSPMMRSLGWLVSYLQSFESVEMVHFILLNFTIKFFACLLGWVSPSRILSLCLHQSVNLYNILNKSIRFFKLNMHRFFNCKRWFIEHSISFASIRITNLSSNLPKLSLVFKTKYLHPKTLK